MPLLIRVDLLWIGSTAGPRREAQQKHTEREFTSSVSDLKSHIINSDNRHWLPTQVRSSRNVFGYSYASQGGMSPSSQARNLIRNTTESGGGLNRKSTARVPFFCFA